MWLSILNTDGWDLTSETVKGKPWSAINTAIEAAIANIAANENFMMASAGEGAGIEGALTGVKVHKPTAYTSEAINQAKTERNRAIQLKSLWID